MLVVQRKGSIKKSRNLENRLDIYIKNDQIEIMNHRQRAGHRIAERDNRRAAKQHHGGE